MAGLEILLPNGQVLACLIYIDSINGPIPWDGSSSLPVGGATAAKQDTGNASLASIDSKITNPLPVSGTVGVTGVATAANQATEIIGLADLLTELTAKTEPANQQHAIIDSSALPTGAALEAGNLATIAAKDFATQTTLALIKAKTDNLDVALSTKALEAGGNLATIAGKDFATQTTLALIKAKTDNLDVALSTKALEAGGNLDAAVTALQIMDDWDETDRAKVNPIVGVVGLAGGTGTDATNALRVTLATNIALPTGSNAIGKLAANSGVDIGDVDITSIAAGDNNIGNVDIVTLPNVTLAAGTNTNEVVGDVAHDSPIAGNPLVVGGVASAAAPAGVSTDQDAVRAWHLLNGAAATVLTAAGALIGGDATNGLDVDITRIPALVASSANIGNVTPVPLTSGGWSVGNFTSGDTYTALTNAAQVIKASAGQFGGYYIYNPNSAATYVMIYNIAAASVTVGTSTAILVFCIPATSAANLELVMGIPFATAMSIAAATTGGGNSAPTTALEAMVWYK